jgi:ubiquinone/menaquinone biosynthesis C-methylase UbiE
MNAAERFVCSSSLWRCFTHRHLLPWILSGAKLGQHLLEIGAGYGAATAFFESRVARVTSLDYHHRSLLKGKLRNNGGTSGAVCGDASRLPFADQTFSSVLAVLVLHHIQSAELQDQLFAECFRVLNPGGVFIAFDIPDGWFHRVGHIRSTFVPVAANLVSPRLNSAGFSEITIDSRKGGFRIIATRAI